MNASAMSTMSGPIAAVMVEENVAREEAPSLCNQGRPIVLRCEYRKDMAGGRRLQIVSIIKSVLNVFPVFPNAARDTIIRGGPITCR